MVYEVIPLDFERDQRRVVYRRREGELGFPLAFKVYKKEVSPSFFRIAFLELGVRFMSRVRQTVSHGKPFLCRRMLLQSASEKLRNMWSI